MTRIKISVPRCSSARSQSQEKHDFESNPGLIPIDLALATTVDDPNKIMLFLNTTGLPIVVPLYTCTPDWELGGVIHNLPRKSFIDDECEGNLGLHSVLITGYDLRKKEFYFKNSWGEDWGDRGYGTITFEALAALYIHDKRACKASTLGFGPLEHCRCRGPLYDQKHLYNRKHD